MGFFQGIKSFFSTSIIHTKDVNFTIGTLIALVLAFVITNQILLFIRRLLTQKLPVADKLKFASVFQFVKYFVYLIVIMFTLNASGVNISVLITASAALFLGLGFALQQLFQDIIGGLMIILDQSLRVGDVIEIEKRVGKVTEINLRSTRVVTRNERVMIVPNHKFMSEILFNWTQNNDIVREDISVGVAYDTDIELARKILLEIANADPRVLKKPKAHVFFENFAESRLDFTLYVYVTDSFAVPSLKSDIRFEINKNFKSHNIRIPYPQHDVFIHNSSNR